MERSQVQWGTTAIPYVIRRSARRSTVSIAVDPEEGVVLTAPVDTPVPRLDGVVRAKARWISQALREGAQQPVPVKKELISGETLLYLGKQYRLRVMERRTNPGVALQGGWLIVKGRADRESTRAALMSWYERRAGVRLPACAAHWAERLGVDVAGVVIRDQQKRWGSCDAKGVLRFNWRIVQAPPALVNYVVAHEVVHLKHDTHGRRFWATLGRLMPDYESRRDELRRLGPSLDW